MIEYFHCVPVKQHGDKFHPLITTEQEDWNLNSIIRFEAESYADCNCDDEDDDDEWERIVEQTENAIWHDLETKGIWKDEFGSPVFLRIEH